MATFRILGGHITTKIEFVATWGRGNRFWLLAYVSMPSLGIHSLCNVLAARMVSGKAMEIVWETVEFVGNTAGPS